MKALASLPPPVGTKVGSKPSASSAVAAATTGGAVRGSL